MKLSCVLRIWKNGYDRFVVKVACDKVVCERTVCERIKYERIVDERVVYKKEIGEIILCKMLGDRYIFIYERTYMIKLGEKEDKRV